MKENLLPTFALLMLVESTVHSRRTTTAVVAFKIHGVLQVSLKAFKRMDVRNMAVKLLVPAVLQLRKLLELVMEDQVPDLVIYKKDSVLEKMVVTKMMVSKSFMERMLEMMLASKNA